MLKPTVAQALNDHINAELYSAYLYYAMAAYFENVNLPGFAHWMRCQAMEEMLHAHKLVKYVSDRGAQVEFKPVEAPPSRWEGPLAVMEATYAHEQTISARIHGLLETAMTEGDYATAGMLQWFVTEQVEEEATVETLLQQLRMAAESKSALFMFDREMGARQAPDPTAQL